MEQLNSREALLEAMQSLRGEIERVVAEAGQEQTAESGSFEAWSLKDLIAHLTSWRLMTAARLEAGLHGGEPVTPWPAHLDEEEDLDEINLWFFEANRDKSPAEIMRESRETFDRVERAIAEMPERDLLEPGRFAWMGDYPLGLGPAVVHGTLDHHHREHGADFRALLAQG